MSMSKSPSFKLKHLPELISGRPDYSKIMAEVCGYKNNWIGRKWVFVWKFRQAYRLVKEAQDINPNTVEENPDCEIKRPNSIDHIPFVAMLDIQSLLSNAGNNDNTTQLIIELIAKSSYSSNCDGDYNSSSDQYKDFRKRVEDMPLADAFGLYNWIDKQLDESVQFWNQKFFGVQVDDQDFELAGGAILNNFNVINTIKSICADFNITEKEAWQVSYSMVQTNSLAKATERFIQDRMRVQKESRMRQQRGQQVR